MLAWPSGAQTMLAQPDPRTDARDAGSPLFRWQAHDMVLIGERDGDAWVLARAWKDGDRLTDVRRWRFVVAERFCLQVARLMADCGAGRDWQNEARAAAAIWVAGSGG